MDGFFFLSVFSARQHICYSALYAIAHTFALARVSGLIPPSVWTLYNLLIKAKIHYTSCPVLPLHFRNKLVTSPSSRKLWGNVCNGLLGVIGFNLIGFHF